MVSKSAILSFKMHKQCDHSLLVGLGRYRNRNRRGSQVDSYVTLNRIANTLAENKVFQRTFISDARSGRQSKNHKGEVDKSYEKG